MSLAQRLQQHLFGLASRRAASGTPIGLWAGSEGLQLIQLQRAGGGLTLRAARSLPWPAPRESVLADAKSLAALIAEGLGSRPFRGRRAVSALGAPEVKLMVLSYSLEGDRSEPERILGLVGERIGEPLESLVVDYQPIRMTGESESEHSALVAVARRESVIAHLECFRRAGLEIDALEIAPTAIRRLLEQMTGGDPAENCIALFSEGDRSHLVVLWGRRLILYRELDFGERAVVEQVAKALELEAKEADALIRRFGVHPPAAGEPALLDPAGALEIAQTLMEIAKPAFYALAEHIDRSVVYTASKARGAAPGRVYLLGGMARWPRAERLLEELTSLRVQRLELRDAFPFGPEAAQSNDFELAGGMALAAGLALRGTGADG